jgi:hypothetical protein
MNLPRCLYPPNKCFIYHEKVGQLLFPEQPLLKELALENELVTVTESDPSFSSAAKSSTGLNHVQRNVIREWLERPVRADHGVYRAAAAYRSDSIQRRKSQEERCYSESEAVYRLSQSHIPRGATGWNRLNSGFASAAETRRRSDDGGDGVSKRVAKRKRKFYGTLLLPATTVSGMNRRRRGDESGESLRLLLEAEDDEEDDDNGNSHELVALDIGPDNLGFARDCLLDRRAAVTTYQL